MNARYRRAVSGGGGRGGWLLEGEVVCAMFATRDTFFDDDTDQVGGAEPEQAELENAVIMPMPMAGMGESLVPGGGGGGTSGPGRYAFCWFATHGSV